MKRAICLTLLGLLLTLLCACAPQEAAPEEPSQTSQTSASSEPIETPQETIPMQTAPLRTGVQEENGAYFYYDAEGRRVEERGMQELDGKRYYRNRDCSLYRFTTGTNNCEGTIYVHAGEDGFSFSPAAEGYLELDGALYAVQADGSVLQNAQEGYLTFGADGKYTSGNETLDDGVQALLDTACEKEASREEELRQAYDYIRDNFKDLSMRHYDAGTTDWAEEAALAFLEQGKGNCYCFAGLFLYCARRLGYQAYVVAGWESKPTNDHAWTMIEQDGKTLLYDVQLEYAYLYMFHRDPVDMFAAEEENGLYRGFAYYFPTE